MSHVRTTLHLLRGPFAVLLLLGLSVSALAQNTPQYERFAGRLADKSGTPLVGTVTVNSTQKATASDGTFELYAPTAQRYIIQAQKTGYVSTSFIHTGQSLETMDIRLSKAELFSLSPGQVVNVVDNRGTNVTIPANSLVDSSGRVATVPVTLSLYTYDLRNDQMVGDMTAIDSSGQQVMLQSIGAFSAEFTDSAGKTYNLAPGSKATISMKADPGNPFTGTVPLWWYDTTRGLWIEEGAGTVSDGVATGQVSHFTVWNFDTKVTNPACVKLTVDPAYLYTYPTPGGTLNVKMTLALPWLRTVITTLNNPNPNTLINLPPNTNVSIDVNGSPYAVVNTGAAWGGTGYPPYPYDVCKGSLVINATPKTGKIEGKVFRQHRLTSGGVTVKVFSGSTLAGSSVTDSSGPFSVVVPAGTYSVTSSLIGYLPASRASVTIGPGTTTTLPLVTLSAGDVSGDNCVTWANDIVPIGNALGTAVTSTDPRDINGSRVIDWDDITKASANGGLCGPVSW